MQHFIIAILLTLLAVPVSAAISVDDLQILVANRKFATAVRAGEVLLAREPAQIRVKFLTAYAYQMNSQADKASQLYRELIKTNPQLPEPRNNLAMIYLAKGDYDAASKLLVEAINTHNSYATAYQNLSRIYTGIASEAYRRALSESKEPTKYNHKIELAALTELEPVGEANDIPLSVDEIAPTQGVVQTNNVEATLSERVEQWAKAWSSKDFATYINFYSSEHRPNFATHSEWLEYRRQRILRPGFISIGVSDIQIRAQNDNRAIIDFKQSFDSPSYSDRVVKRLGFRLIDSQWKITDERVLSVL